MQTSAGEISPTPDPLPKPSQMTLPGWVVAIIAAVAVAALVFAAILQVEVASIQSEESGLGSRQMFSGVVNVTQDLYPGNGSLGYWGSASFGSTLGNGNPLVLQITVLEAVGAAVTLEFDVCSEPEICAFPGGSLDILPITTDLSETQIVLEPATGSYELHLFNLPGYADGRPVVTVDVQVNVTLLGQVDFRS
jgi:hypothetical protein